MQTIGDTLAKVMVEKKAVDLKASKGKVQHTLLNTANSIVQTSNAGTGWPTSSGKFWDTWRPTWQREGSGAGKHLLTEEEVEALFETSAKVNF